MSGLLTAAALAAASLPAVALAQQPPVFGSTVELVRLDVIVVDRDGKPVAGLGRDDFIVEEGGQSQPITSFEAVVVVGRSVAPVSEPPRISAARLRSPAEGRAFYVFFDDAHVTPTAAEHVRTALKKFIQTELRDGDWITVMAPQQGLWWTARNAWEYRQLESVVARLKGQYVRDPGEKFGMSGLSDFDAMCIVEALPSCPPEKKVGLAAQQTREYRPGNGVGTGSSPPGAGGTSGSGSGSGGGGGGGGGGTGDGAMGVGLVNLDLEAREVYGRARRRIALTFSGLHQALDSLVPLRGHKALLLVSEGFILVPDMPGYAEMIDTARRANVAVHFLDPRGLESGWGEDEAPGLGWATRRLLDSAGADDIAGATGGRSFVSNDPGVGLRQVASESDAYYLLGYQPGDTKTGERKVKVRARRDGVTVRARTRYYVEAPKAAIAEKGGQGMRRDAAEDSPALQAMHSLSDTTDLPLRVSTLFFEPNQQGEVATMLAAEVVPPPGKGSARAFRLVSEARSRDGGPVLRDQFEVSPQVAAGVPAILARQWSLTPGVWQVRLLVEDAETKRIGTLIHTFEVPSPKSFRVSTPILTAEIEDPNGKRRPKVALGRTFHTGSVLYCQYSAYGAPAAGQHNSLPRVFGAWTLRRGDAVVREAPPTLIQPAADGRVTRTLGISLQGASPGEYALALSARDENTGEVVTRTEPFTVAP